LPDDGWYALDNLNPPSTGHYNTDHLIYINIMPDKGSMAVSQPVTQPVAQQPTAQPATVQTLAANAPATITINNGQRVRLSFTAPSAGEYRFESSNNGSLDPVAYSAVSGSRVISDDGGSGRNFFFTQNLRAGEVFTFYAGFLWDRGNGSYTVSVKLP
jgi:hypothetical protein